MAGALAVPLAGAAAAGAVVVAGGGHGAVARLRALRLPARRVPPPVVNRAARPTRRGLVALSAGASLAVFMLTGGVFGLLAAGLTAVGSARLLARSAGADDRRQRQRCIDSLPVRLDLLAACLASGTALPTALRLVIDGADDGDSPLRAVLTAIDVGAAPPEAWAAAGIPELAAVARVVARSGERGTLLASELSRLAADLRDGRRLAGQEKARRAGVLAVAPLGLCFLPAFVLIGVVPVVAGLARGLFG